MHGTGRADKLLIEHRRNEDRHPDIDSAEWKEMVKPLFLEMCRRGLVELTIRRDGTHCNLKAK